MIDFVAQKAKRDWEEEHGTGGPGHIPGCPQKEEVYSIVDIMVIYFKIKTFKGQMQLCCMSKGQKIRVIFVTCCYYSSIPVANELYLASRESKSCLISGGDSSYPWVFIRALDLSGRRSC